MAYPKEILEIARRAAEKYTDDIKQAKQVAVRKIKALPMYEEFVDMLVGTAVAGLVDEARHRRNVVMRKAMGLYGGPAKVVVGGSKSVQQIELDLYSFAVNGRELGSVKGEELEGLAGSEFAVGSGYYFRGRLLLGCRRFVPDGKTVRESMTTAQLRKVFQEAQKKDKVA